MIKKLLPSLLAILTSSIAPALTASAQTAATSPLDPIAAQIAATNPSLRATSLRLDASRAELLTQNTLPDPEISVSPQFGRPGQKVGVEATQSFDWPGVYTARARAARAQSAAMTHQLDARRLEITTQIKTLLIDIIASRQLVDLHTATLSHIDSLITAADRAAACGDLSRLDLNKLRIERLLAARRLGEATLSLSASTSQLQTLAGGDTAPSVGPLISTLQTFPLLPLLPLDTYLQAATTRNPSLLQADALTAAARLDAQATLRQRLPGFTLGYTYEYDLGDHYSGFTLGLTLPIFSSRHRRQASTATILALQAEATELAATTRSEIISLHSRLQSLDTEIAAMTQALDSGDNLRLLTRAYAARQITLLDYLQDRAYFLDAHTLLIDLLRQRDTLHIQLSQYL